MTKSRLRAPFPWFGGKGSPKIQKAILSVLPDHKQYVEPFGGAASILITKPPSPVEIYNDVDRGAVGFFRVLANPTWFPHFLSRVSMLPCSRALYDEYVRTWQSVSDPVERAVQWYYVARQSFGGSFGASWAVITTSSTRGMAQPAASWQSAVDALPQIHQRLRRVEIECCDFRDCLKRYCGPDYLAYCDPPYVGSTRKSGGYAHELTDIDHKTLIETLLTYEGSVVLSGYRTPLYRPLEDAGWQCMEVPVTCSAAGRTRASGLQGAGKVRAQQRRVECIWRNPLAVQRAPKR